jgi:NTE family protein
MAAKAVCAEDGHVVTAGEKWRDAMPVTSLRRIVDRPRTAFVLGGGGNLGAIQVGMLQALADRGIMPDLVVGCSVGALNGAAVAADPSPAGVDHLARIWRRLRADDIFPSGWFNGPWMLLRRSLSMTGSGKLRALILATAGLDTFEEAKVPFHVVATSLRTGRPRWFTTGPVVEPILASAALPAVLPPVEIDGEMYIDGAVVDNVPISRAVELGAERVYVLHVGNFDRARPLPQRPIDVLIQAFSIARNERFLRESIGDHFPGVELIVLPGIDPGGAYSRKDFSRSSELMERSRIASGVFLDSTLRAAAGA